MSLHYSHYSIRPTYTQEDAANALYTLLEVMSTNQVKTFTDELRTLARYLEFDADTFEQMVGEGLLTEDDAELEQEEAAYDYYLSTQEQED